jgi:hypothetical protein
MEQLTVYLKQTVHSHLWVKEHVGSYVVVYCNVHRDESI